MVNIQVIAAILLIIRVVSVLFMSVVIRKQVALLKRPIRMQAKTFRYTLMALSVAILIGNIIPILVDALTLFVDTSRPSELSNLSIFYSMSNALTALLSSLAIWFLYRTASNNTKKG